MFTFVVHYGDKQEVLEIPDKDYASFIEILKICKLLFDVDKKGFSLATNRSIQIKNDADLLKVVDSEKSDKLHLYLKADSHSKPLQFKLPDAPIRPETKVDEVLLQQSEVSKIARNYVLWRLKVIDEGPSGKDYGKTFGVDVPLQILHPVSDKNEQQNKEKDDVHGRKGVSPNPSEMQNLSGQYTPSSGKKVKQLAKKSVASCPPKSKKKLAYGGQTISASQPSKVTSDSPSKQAKSPATKKQGGSQPGKVRKQSEEIKKNGKKTEEGSCIGRSRGQKHPSIEENDERSDDNDSDDSDFRVSDEEFVYTESDDDEWLKEAVDEDKMLDAKAERIVDGIKLGGGFDGSDSDDWDLDSNESDNTGSNGEISVEEDGEEKKINLKKVDPTFGIKGKTFRPQEGGRVVLEVMHIFKDVYHFREVLKEYAVWEGINFIYKKNQKEAVGAKCAADGCPFYIWASKVAGPGSTFMIKKLINKHTCVRLEKVRTATAKWIARVLLPFLRADPDMSNELMFKCLKEPYGVEPHPHKVWRGKQIAIDWIDGSHHDSFLKLPQYVDHLIATNPGIIAKFKYVERDVNDTSPPIFERIFICYKASRDGFVDGCRPFIGLDGCFLKGPYGGCLLSVVSVDGNMGIFPIAFAVVEKESIDSWNWFLDLLHDAITDDIERKPLTFMSDRQKGIINAVDKHFGWAVHRKCARHLYANFRRKWPGLELRKLFWTACKSYCHSDHQKAMHEIAMVVGNDDPVKWLRHTKSEEWCRWTYDERVKCNHVTNNMTESFNHWIGKFRNKPILTLLENIRMKLMARLHRRYAKAASWQGRVTPKVKEMLEKVSTAARFLKLVPASNEEFQVIEESDKFSVNLKTKNCSCRAWIVSGIPCKHVAACANYMRMNLEDLCDDYFTVKNYLAAHKNMIHPLFETNLDLIDGAKRIQPPPLKRKPGRPKRLRTREKGEEKQPRMRSCTVTCGRCKKYGHNARTCKEPVPGGSTIPNTRQGKKRKQTSKGDGKKSKKDHNLPSQGASQEASISHSQPSASQQAQ